MDEIWGVDLERVVRRADGARPYMACPFMTVDQVYDYLEGVACDIIEYDECCCNEWEAIEGDWLLNNRPFMDEQAMITEENWFLLNIETENWLKARNVRYNHGDTYFHKKIGKYHSKNRPDRDDDGSGYIDTYPDHRIGHASDIKLSDRRDQRRKAHVTGELRNYRRSARRLVKDQLKSDQIDRVSNCIPVRWL